MQLGAIEQPDYGLILMDVNGGTPGRDAYAQQLTKVLHSQRSEGPTTNHGSYLQAAMPLLPASDISSDSKPSKAVNKGEATEKGSTLIANRS